MTTLYTDFYKELATGMNEMLVSIGSDTDAIERVLEILDYLMNLTTDADFSVSQALIDIRPAIMDVYRGLTVLAGDDDQLWPGIIALNEHTKKYINSDLTDFVNNEVWTEECVPYEWSIISEVTGEDISGWNVCDPS